MVTDNLTGTVTGLFHVGVTVSNLDRSLQFYQDLMGFELVAERRYTEAYIMEITSAPAHAIRIAFLAIPGSDVRLELLEYQGLERLSGSVRPYDYGSGHFCVYVEDIDALYLRLHHSGVTARSEGPVSITAGINRGSKAMYLRDPDGYHIEIFERLPPSSEREMDPAGAVREAP